MEKSDKIVIAIITGIGFILVLIPWVVSKFIKEEE